MRARRSSGDGDSFESSTGVFPRSAAVKRRRGLDQVGDVHTADALG